MDHPRLDAFRVALEPFDGVVTPHDALPAVSLPDAPRHAALREGAALIPAPDRERVLISGRDRLTFLHGLLTNNIRDLNPSQGCLAAFLTIKGKMMVDLRIAARDVDLLIETPFSRGAAFLEALDGYLFREKVTLHDTSADFGALILAGPRLGERFDALGWTPPIEPYGRARVSLGEHDLDLTRGNWLEAPSFTLWCPTDDLGEVIEALLEAGLELVDTEAFETARVESGVPRHFVDTDADTIPLEAPIPDIIHFAKGCYLGQEVIARVDSRGAVNRHLVGLALSTPAEVGASVIAPPDSDKPGKTLGHLTSVVQTPEGRHIAFGWVRRGFQTPETAVLIGEDGAPAQVIALPVR